MNPNRIVIVHKRASVAESLRWCFELFEADEILCQNPLQPDNLTSLTADILLIDIDNFLRLVEEDVYPPCPVLLVVEQMNSSKLVEALYAGISSVADISKGPEEVMLRAKLILTGHVDDSITLIKMVMQSYAATSTGQMIDTDYGITNKEREILKAMREGAHLKLIAYNTGTTYDTVRTHVKHIYKKIGVMSASEAVIKALKMNL